MMRREQKKQQRLLKLCACAHPSNGGVAAQHVAGELGGVGRAVDERQVVRRLPAQVRSSAAPGALLGARVDLRGGLNGEAALVEWLGEVHEAELVEAPLVYDLSRRQFTLFGGEIMLRLELRGTDERVCLFKATPEDHFLINHFGCILPVRRVRHVKVELVNLGLKSFPSFRGTAPF